MTVTLYGIKNCDTMKKAFGWLDEQGVDYAFHDYKKAGVTRDALERWCDAAGWRDRPEPARDHLPQAAGPRPRPTSTGTRRSRSCANSPR